MGRRIREDRPWPSATQEFELCDHFQMLSLMAYSDASHYPHWSCKGLWRQKTLYDQRRRAALRAGDQRRLAYSCATLAGAQILTIAHVR
jgi:hypothetical protein